MKSELDRKADRFSGLNGSLEMLASAGKSECSKWLGVNNSDGSSGVLLKGAVMHTRVIMVMGVPK